MNPYLLLLILVPLLAAMLALCLKRFAGLFALFSVIYTAVSAAILYFSGPVNNLLLNKFGVELVMDGLSGFLLVTANLVALLVVVYSLAYLDKRDYQERFYALFLVMLAGLNGLVLAAELGWLFIFLEVAALAAYALVAFSWDKKQLEASIKYFVMGEVASLFILFAIGIVFKLTGTLNLAEAGEILPVTNAYSRSLAVAFFIIGFGMKAALVPFHSWLPDAHTAAPSPVSAMLSGVIIKALGVYAIARILFNVFGMTPQLSALLAALGVVSILVGGFLSVGQWDMKRLMAYSSISQIGYIILGLGLATPLGIMGGLFHLFNHAFMKSLLFLNAGAVEKKTGSRDLRELGGLRQKMPVTAATSLIGSLAISGLPPFGGFWSKLFIIIACVQAGKLWFALAAILGSLLTMGSFLRMQKYAFFGRLKDKFAAIKEAPLAMSLAVIILALVCLGLGVFFPLVISYVINPAVVTLANGVGYSKLILEVR